MDADEQWVGLADLIASCPPELIGNDNFPCGLQVACQHGRVVGRARAAVFQSNNQVERKSFWEIPPAAWAKGRVSGDCLRGRSYFPAQELGVNVPMKVGLSGSSFELTGLSFAREDVRQALGIKFAEKAFEPARQEEEGRAAVVSPSKGGKPIDKERWGEFAAALATCVYRGHIDPHGSIGKAYKVVAQFLSDRELKGMDESSVRASIAQALAWLKEPDAAG